jgi:hypothetical protein
MTIYFFPRGRLGNAIFRYFACALFCIFYNHEYSVKNSVSESSISDNFFIEWMNASPENYTINEDMIFTNYYQHDTIYKKHKMLLLEYMNNHSDHFVLTDGITAGDLNYQKFFIRDLLYEPVGFSKLYDTVIHIRLDDHVTHGLHIAVEYVLSLLDSLSLSQNSCIVVQAPSSDFEKEYIQTLSHAIFERHGFWITIESNDTLTDYHIMKNARILVCSMSTLSWAAAFLSTRIEKCYFPDHRCPHGPHSSCKYPIDNTELYNIH